MTYQQNIQSSKNYKSVLLTSSNEFISSQLFMEKEVKEGRLVVAIQSQNVVNYLWKPLLISIGIVGFYILTHRIWEELFNAIIVNPILSKVEKNCSSDTVFLLGIASIIIYTCNRREKKYIPSYKLFWATIIFTTLYGYYRCTNSVWSFTSFSLVEELKYFDLIFIVAICYFALIAPFYKTILFPKPESKIDETGFMFDQPIGGKDNEDKLGYEPYATTVAKKLNHTNGDNAFAMGINGKWGSGKTSFLKMVRKHLDKTDVIEIEFNPWNSHTPTAIIEDFFGTMQYELAKHHSGISKQIRSYSKKLLELNNNALTRGIQFSSSTLFGEESLGQLKQDVQKSLEILNKKIVVYIDDLDRLDKNEIIEVLRLIRNTADFKNTIFVVCYDRQYILEALKDLNNLSTRYLEKIIQLEITLPFFEPSKLRNELALRLYRLFHPDYHEIINRTLNESYGYHEGFQNIIDNWSLNFRDITLLVNSLSLNSSNLFKEFHFPDLLKLELIRLKYPNVHELLHKKRTECFKIDYSNVSAKRQYMLAKSDKDIVLNEVLVKSSKDLGITEQDITLIMQVMTKLFSDNRYESEDPHELSIVFPSKFHNYFSFGISEGRLSNYEFISSFEKPLPEFKNQIDDWIKRGLEIELINRLSIIGEFDNKDHFEKLINSIFYLANKKSQFIEDYFAWGKIVGYPAKTLFNSQLYNFENRISNLYNTSTEWIDFIKPFFINAKPPYYFESVLISYFNDQNLSKEHPEYYIFDQEEGAKISGNYFISYLESIDHFDHNIWQLYHLSKKTTWNSISLDNKKSSPPLKQVKTAFVKFIENNDIDGFLLSILSTQPWAQNYRIQSIVLELFDDWNTFSIFINETVFEKSVYITEFRLFLSELKGKSFDDYIPFEFNEIPVEKKDN